MKHVKLMSKRPALALDLDEMPIDIEFIIDIMTAVIQMKGAKGT